MRRRLALVSLALFVCLSLPPGALCEVRRIPVDFYVDRDRPVVAVVRVEAIQTSQRPWMHYFGPCVSLVTCSIEEVLRGSLATGASTRLAFSRREFMAAEPCRERPPLIGRQYVAWLEPTSERERADLGAPYLVEQEGLVPLYRSGNTRYISWQGREATLEQVRAQVTAAPATPLDQVSDPSVRIRVVLRRLQQHTITDVDGVVRGMALILAAPTTQAACVRSTPWILPDGRDCARRPPTPYELWVACVRCLQEMASDLRLRPRVLQDIRPLLTSAQPRVRLELAMVLADQGDSAGRDTLLAALRQSSFSLDQAPPGYGNEWYYRFRFDSSVWSAAYYLGRMGDTSGLRESDPRTVMAAVEGLALREGAQVEAACRSVLAAAEHLDKTFVDPGERLMEDVVNGPPWVRARGALAARGDAQSLEILVRAAVEARDRRFGKNWPGLFHTLQRLVSGPPGAARLKAIRSMPGTARLVTELEESPSLQGQQEPRRVPTRDEIHDHVVRDLAGKSGHRILTFLEAAAYRFDDLYPIVRAVALGGQGDERRRAVRALGLYGLPLSEQDRNRLMTEGDREIRVVALEVLCGFEPNPDPEACASSIRELLRTLPARTDMDFTTQSGEWFLLQLGMARLLSTTVPKAWREGLADPDGRVRTFFVQAGARSGNPDVVPAMQGMLNDPHPTIRRYAEWCVRNLPWP